MKNLNLLIEEKMQKFIDKFYEVMFNVNQFFRYNDIAIMWIFLIIVISLFALSAKNLALIIALAYIMAKVTK
jgi:hypothetical protein